MKGTLLLVLLVLAVPASAQDLPVRGVMPLEIAADTGLEAEILDERQMAEMGMGGVVAVGQGAQFAPRFIARPWIHLDIAGTSWPDNPGPHVAGGPTGVTTRTLAELARLMGGTPAATQE